MTWVRQLLTPEAVDGTAEVFLPVTSASLATAVAFLPILIMTRNRGAIVPETRAFSLTAALFAWSCIQPWHGFDFGGPRFANSIQKCNY